MKNALNPRQGRRIYLEILRRMTPEERLMKAFELTRFARDLFKQGLRTRYPELPDSEIHALYLKHLDKCHNRNY